MFSIFVYMSIKLTEFSQLAPVRTLRYLFCFFSLLIFFHSATCVPHFRTDTTRTRDTMRIRAQLICKTFIFFLTQNHGHYLPLEAQIWFYFWSRTMFLLARLTNFWGKSLQMQQIYDFFIFLIRESTNFHNLPLQIDNANLYQPTYNMIMCTRISYRGKNDQFWHYPTSDGRMKYFLGKFSTF